MCGFVGLLADPIPLDRDAIPPLVRAMATRITHRGPDDEGVYVDDHARCAFGFRRLSIIDLSAAGHQPMVSADGRFVIVFNGEVYDHSALRSELEARGVRFRGHSDTEVIVEAFAHFGPEVVTRLAGMFAIALWDRRERTLRLFRDHVGKKPLYFGRIGGMWAFSSELSPLHLVPGFARRVNRDALVGLLRYAAVPSPTSIFEGISQLPPGHVALLKPDSVRADVRPFFEPRELVEAPRFPGTTADAIDAVDAQVRAAVKKRMVADVPLGAFLSGGIDSSLVVGMMQSLSGAPVKTFTIGYDEEAYDEAEHAAHVARHLGTDHHLLRIRAADAMAVIPRLADIYDEPFADASQVPTYLVSELARTKVTVALSGDGGDESFGGYNRYFEAPRLFRRARHLPLSVRRSGFGALASVSSERWDRALHMFGGVVPGSLRKKLSGDRIQKAARMLAASSSIDEVYLALLSNHTAPESFVIGGRDPRTAALAPPSWLADVTPVERMMMLDTLVYLPNDILVKVDRATMANSLEARAPLLDIDLVRLAWSLPLELKVRDSGKWILREVLERYVPRALFERPKRGFGIPVEHWLRTDLRPWAEDLLARDALVREGFFDADRVRRLWDEHARGINHQVRLWPILMFQQWQRRWLAPSAVR